MTDDDSKTVIISRGEYRMLATIQGADRLARS